jgi:hypothetical protein
MAASLRLLPKVNGKPILVEDLSKQKETSAVFSAGFIVGQNEEAVERTKVGSGTRHGYACAAPLENRLKLPSSARNQFVRSPHELAGVAAHW